MNGVKNMSGGMAKSNILKVPVILHIQENTSLLYKVTPSTRDAGHYQISQGKGNIIHHKYTRWTCGICKRLGAGQKGVNLMVIRSIRTRPQLKLLKEDILPLTDLY